MAFLAALLGGSGAAATAGAAAGAAAGTTAAVGATSAFSLGTALSLAGTAVSVLGAIGQGNIAQAVGDYNAQLAEQNEVLARKQAAEEERRFRISMAKQLGSLRSAYARAGVTMEGSPMDVLAESAYTAELDALTIREGGRAQASTLRSEANLERLSGRAQQTGSYYSAASELLGGAANYYQMTRT